MSQINVNTITGKDGGSAVNFPHGITVTGVVTATTLNQNVSGIVTATSFSGPLTGDVTGNVTGNCSGTAGFRDSRQQSERLGLFHGTPSWLRSKRSRSLPAIRHHAYYHDEYRVHCHDDLCDGRSVAG